MQRVDVQFSGSRVSVFGSESAPHDWCPICICRQGLYREAHSTPVTDTVYATNNVVEVVCDTTFPECYSHLFLEIPHFTMESAESIRRSLSRDALVLPSILWISIFTFPSIEATENVFVFRLGHHIPIPGTAVWPFSSTLGILQEYDRDKKNAGTLDGHQSLSVPGRLAHLFTISRPVSPRHCKNAHSLPHDGPPHSRQEDGTDPETEIPFSGIPVQHGFLPSHSNSGSISQNRALICSFLLRRGGCAHTWQILLILFVSTDKTVLLGRLHTREAQHCISQHWDFNVLTSNLWIPLFPHGGGRFPIVEVSTQCSEGSPSYSDKPHTQLFTNASNIGW